MQNLAYDWHSIIHAAAVRQHPLFSQLEAGDFDRVVDHFRGGKTPYDKLADYLLYGAAAILGRHQEAAQSALGYHERLNTKTKAVALFFWAQEAVAHLQYQTAEGFLKPLIECYPKDPELNAIAANCCFYTENLARGRPYMEAGLESAPGHIGLNSLLCRYHLNEGGMEAAEQAAWNLLKLDPVNPTAFNILSRIVPEQIEDRLIERFEHRALEGGLGPINSASLLFDTGRVQDARGDYMRAFSNVEHANRLMRSIPQVVGAGFDEDREIESFCISRRLFDALKPIAETGSITPIFIVGLPRTGSTLLDQALAAHPEVVSLGENDSIPAFVQEAEKLLKQGKTAEVQARMPEWRDRFFARALANSPDQPDSGQSKPGQSKPGVNFVVDKMLGNSRHLGFLQALFPTAKFLHCRRNMMDVGLSIYFSPLLRTNVYATDLNSIADFIAVDEQVIRTWTENGIAVQPVAYEDMVDDMEGTLRRVFTHVGLDWDPDCLDFHRKKRAVHTYSAHQVRKAIYKSSKGRWQNYAGQLAPFQAALQSKGVAADHTG